MDYDEILATVNNDPAQIQALYEAQWDDLHSKSKAKFLDDSFEGPQQDQILVNLLNDPSYQDPRNNLVIWARPSPEVVDLVLKCQSELQKLSPNIWLTPQDCLHATVLVIAQNLSPEALASEILKSKPTLHKAALFLQDQHTRLVKPRLSYSESGVVLSYVPSAGDITVDQTVNEDYTFLHLQRDLFELFRGQGIEMEIQKPPGSYYIAVARFITNEDHSSDGKPDRAVIASWVAAIEEINDMLKKEYWPCEGTAPGAGNWVVGKENGLHIREGTCWYGGGRSLEF